MDDSRESIPAYAEVAEPPGDCPARRSGACANDNVGVVMVDDGRDRADDRDVRHEGSIQLLVVVKNGDDRPTRAGGRFQHFSREPAGGQQYDRSP